MRMIHFRSDNVENLNKDLLKNIVAGLDSDSSFDQIDNAPEERERGIW